MSTTSIGLARPRPATRRLVAGRGRYVDDIALPRMAHLAFLRSPHARAAIRHIETAEALALPGVLAVFTGADLAAICQAWQGNATTFPGLNSPRQRALAIDRASFQGEAVAAVVATSRALAEDGVERIVVEWEIEVATTSLRTAAAAPPAHPDLASNLGFETTISVGDFAAARRDAAIIVSDEIDFSRQTGVTLEPRGVIADFEPAEGTLTLHHSHQVPNEIQALLAGILGLEQHRIRIICPDVGGGFGIKLHLYAEEVATAAIARLLGRPVKFIADRLEAFVGDIHAREHIVKGEMAVDATGRITGIGIDDLFGMGAYSAAPRTSVAEGMLALRSVGSPYDFGAFEARLQAVFQNRTPTGQYRAVGLPIGVGITERLVDRAAAELGIDAAEFRRRNLVPAEKLPWVNPAGVPLFELSQQECLEKLLDLMRWEDLKAERDRLRTTGVYRGLGLAAFVEPTGPGPETNGRGGLPVIAMESVTLKIEPSGGIRCLIGTTEQGQGTSAGIAQIVAASIGVAVEDVAVLSGDTAMIPAGGGAWASRGIVIGGEAAWQAGRLLRSEVLRLAAALLQSDAEALDLVDGDVIDRGSSVRLTLRELAETVYYRGYLIPDGLRPQFALTHQYRRETHPFVPTNGIQASYVELDPELGKVTLLHHWVVEDCGVVINPLLVDGQIRGGVVQGIGPALTEACRYDESGQLLSGTLADYLVPMAGDMPDITVAHVETPYSGSAIGAKGVGEAGTAAAGAALLNAVNDALAPFGASVSTLPMTPSVILEALGALPSRRRA